MNKFDEQLQMIWERVSNHKRFLKICDRGGDWTVDEFMESLSGRVNGLKDMLTTQPSAISDDLMLTTTERLEELEQIEKYYNCIKTFDGFSAKIFFDIVEDDERSFDELMEEHIALINKPKEYRLLQSLPFLNSESIFIEYTLDATTMEYYTDSGDGESAWVFSDYENAMLRSIVSNDEWVEEC